MKKYFLGICILSAVLFSCGKSGDGGAPGPACNFDAATVAGSYKISAISYKVTPSSDAIDGYAFLESCKKDDIYKLNTDGSAEYQDAGTLCSPTSSFNTTWSLSGNNIIIDGKSYVVIAFNCSTLTGRASSYNVAGDEATVTFVRQ